MSYRLVDGARLNGSRRRPPATARQYTLRGLRGWVGIFLGRSSDAIGTWEVWVPAINRKVRSSSLTIDEEFFPWHGENAHQPLTSLATSARFLSDHLGPTEQLAGPPAPTEFVKPSDINETPRSSLSFLNLFSGPYSAHREGGLSKTLQAFGWDSVRPQRRFRRGLPAGRVHRRRGCLLQTAAGIQPDRLRRPAAGVRDHQTDLRDTPGRPTPPAEDLPLVHRCNEAAAARRF